MNRQVSDWQTFLVDNDMTALADHHGLIAALLPPSRSDVVSLLKDVTAKGAHRVTLSTADPDYIRSFQREQRKKREKCKIILSAPDLMRFQGCRHAVAQDLQRLDHDRGDGTSVDGHPVPVPDGDSAALLQRKGNEHERALARIMHQA
jgi:hypothetical protein